MVLNGGHGPGPGPGHGHGNGNGRGCESAWVAAVVNIVAAVTVGKMLRVLRLPASDCMPLLLPDPSLVALAKIVQGKKSAAHKLQNHAPRMPNAIE